jgi:hypothetical protein
MGFIGWPDGCWRWSGFEGLAKSVLDGGEVAGGHAVADEGFEFGLVDFDGHRAWLL